MEDIFVNVYFDEEGKFLGDHEYSKYKYAYEMRDDLDNYVETIQIIRHTNAQRSKNNKTMKEEEYLEMTFIEEYPPKNKTLRWFWDMKWNIMNLWRLRFLAWFYLTLYKIVNALQKKLTNQKPKP